MASNNPKDIKSFGRKIENFDQETWNKNNYSIIVKGNFSKFNQNPKLKEILLKNSKIK